jgi:pyridoxamine 5'-phosphate oxidase family protein
MPTTPKSVFTSVEIEYLKSQRLCRIATVGPDGQPHVVPVSYRYNPDTDTIDVSGHNGFAKRKKWRDVQNDPRVAVVIDDIVSVNPWKVRGIEVRGTVEILHTGGETVIPSFDPEMFRITPKRVISWGLETEFRAAPNARSVN